ncbi:MAG: AMP-binding protein [Thermoleophilaceae bacterium]
MTAAPSLLSEFPEPRAPLNISEYFLEQNVLAGRGGAIAIRYGDEVYTFERLVGLVNRAANVLEEAGVRPEDRVFMFLRDSPHFIATWFATVKKGAITSEAYTYIGAREVRDLLVTLRPKVVVADDDTVEKIRTAAEGLEYPSAILVLDAQRSRLRGREHSYNDLLEQSSATASPWPTTRDDFAYLLFSAGTTGAPKIVPHRHGTAVAAFDSLQRFANYTASDVILPVPKLFFGYARLWGVVLAFRVGASVVLYPERPSVRRILDLTTRYRPSVLVNVPTMMRRMLDEVGDEDLSSLRICTSSGEHLSAELHVRWVERFGVEVLNLLGSTETGGVVLFGNVGGAQAPGSVRPNVGVKTRLVDSGTGRDVAPGEIGLLRICSEGSGLLYWKNYDASRATFVGDGWIRTSDLFREDEDGNFWFCGRADDLVKVAGRFVSPHEVQGCLEGHPDVAECAVFAHEHEDGLREIVAYVVAAPASSRRSDDLADELRRFAKAELAPYKYPQQVYVMAELPATGQGKVDRRRVRAEADAADER